jgi:hypothetical protein
VAVAVKVVGGLHMHSIGRAHRAGGTDQSLKRSHGRVLWAIDALMCSWVGPSRFVVRWFQSIASNCACAVVSRHREMEHETGSHGLRGESRGKGPVLRDTEFQPEFSQPQLPKGQPGVLPRRVGKKGPKKDRTLAEESEEMHAQSATRPK